MAPFYEQRVRGKLGVFAGNRDRPSGNGSVAGSLPLVDHTRVCGATDAHAGTTATTKYLNRYVYIAAVVVCCGEVGMRGETAWLLGMGTVRDF